MNPVSVVNANVAKNVHVPGQRRDTGATARVSMRYARAVKVGEAEVSDVSGAGP